MERGQQWLIRWVLRLVPQPIAEAPERMLINFACVLIGLWSLVPREGSLLSRWWWWLAVEWSLAMALGGAAVILGIWNSERWKNALSLERAGYLAIFHVALVYGAAVIWVHGWSGAFTGAIFLSIAAAKGLRLVVTTAARQAVVRQAQREADE